MVTRFGDWAAMILAVVGVLGCVATVGIVIAGRVASTVGSIRALRVAVTGGQLAAAGRAGSRSAWPVALFGAASMCLTSTWLAGDDLAFRYRTGQVLRSGGWLELAASVVLAAWGVQVLAGIVRRGRSERAGAIAIVGPPRRAAAR